MILLQVIKEDCRPVLEWLKSQKANILNVFGNLNNFSKYCFFIVFIQHLYLLSSLLS